MKCDIKTAALFVGLSVVFGSTFLAAAKASDAFTPATFMAIRLTSAFFSNLLVLGARCAVQKGYAKTVKENFECSFWAFLWQWLAGAIIFALPPCFTTLAQSWIPANSVQSFCLFATAAGNLLSIPLLADEQMDLFKGISTGLMLAAFLVLQIPPFMNPITGATGGQKLLGYIMSLIALAANGTYPVFLKHKNSSFDMTVAACIQMLSASFFSWYWALISDGSDNIATMLDDATLAHFIWTIGIGVVTGSVAVHAYSYLCGLHGVQAGNFTNITQLIVGLLFSFFYTKSWSEYTGFQKGLGYFGLILLIGSTVTAFFNKKKIRDDNLEKPVNPDEDEKETNSLEEKRKTPEEL